MGPKQQHCDSMMFKEQSHWYSKMLATFWVSVSFLGNSVILGC